MPSRTKGSVAFLQSWLGGAMVRRSQCKLEGWRFESRGRRDSFFFFLFSFLSFSVFVFFCFVCFFFIEKKNADIFEPSTFTLDPRHSTLDPRHNTIDPRLSTKTYTRFDPYENVEQKNSSKCYRGQVQRPFPCDSLAFRRILVLLLTSNELG